MTTKRSSSSSGGRTKKNTGAKVSKPAAAVRKEPLLSEGMRSDIIGIVLAAIGVALFVAVVAPGDAIVTAAVSTALHYAFGLGAFIIPIAFVLWGISYFLKADGTSVARIIIGISIVVLGIMSLLALFSPSVSEAEAGNLFLPVVLTSGGGYAGSAVAWVLLSLVGRPVAAIILIAAIAAGLVLTGLSISKPFNYLRSSYERGKDKRGAQNPGSDEVQASVHFADSNSYDDIDDPAYMPRADETIMLGNRKRSNATQTSGKRADKTLGLSDKKSPDARKTVNLSDARQDAQGGVFSSGSRKADGPRQGARVTRSARRNKQESAKATSDATPTQKLDASTVSLAKPATPEGYVLPPFSLLNVVKKREDVSNSELRQVSDRLQQTLEDFSLPARVVGWIAGPTVTMYKVELPSGVRLNRLTSLSDDIALALAAPSVRIAQIPNTSLVGVEIPNITRQTVLLSEVLSKAGTAPLELAIGEDVDGNMICADLAKMPHLLIGGTTGSGKSVAINCMLMSILMRTAPSQVRLILVDPKRVELSLYNDIPHLYVPVVTEPKEAASALRWAVAEMERRLKVFEDVGARNIGLYNQMIDSGALTDDEDEHPDHMPYIVIMIDELSDLMMVAGKDVEDSIVRISQLARAAGIHLILATQRPSSQVITGMIKANITNRIAMSVATSVDSRVILDTSGAEKLLGNGDMLFSKQEWGKPKRIQGCFVSEKEIGEVVKHLREQGKPDYHTEILKAQLNASGGSVGGSSASTNDSEDDPLIWDAADAVVHAGLGSTSMLQRRLKVGYARAGRIMDMLEEKGIVGPPDGSRAREVLIDSVEDLEAIKAFEAQDRLEG